MKPQRKSSKSSNKSKTSKTKSAKARHNTPMTKSKLLPKRTARTFRVKVYGSPTISPQTQAKRIERVLSDHLSP